MSIWDETFAKNDIDSEDAEFRIHFLVTIVAKSLQFFSITSDEWVLEMVGMYSRLFYA